MCFKITTLIHLEFLGLFSQSVSPLLVVIPIPQHGLSRWRGTKSFKLTGTRILLVSSFLSISVITRLLYPFIGVHRTMSRNLWIEKADLCRMERTVSVET